MPYRAESVGKAIRVALSEILRTETRDPGLADVTITSVKMSRDLRTAKVYVSAMPGAEDRVFDRLRGAMAFLRRALAQRVQLRHVPELVFVRDESLAHGARIDQLLDSLNA